MQESVLGIEDVTSQKIIEVEDQTEAHATFNSKSTFENTVPNWRNLELIKTFSSDAKNGLIIDLTEVNEITFEERRFFGSRNLDLHLHKMALVAPNAQSLLFANLFVKFSNSNVEIKVFEDTKTGQEWLDE